MRIRTKPYALAAALGLVLALPLALAGCVQSPTEVIPTSVPSSAPVFASDADALAAAKKAFAGYLAASDQIAHDGGNEVERLAPWDTPSQLKRDTKSFADMRADGHHTTGSSTFSNFALESSEVEQGKAHVVAYICMQIGGTELLDDSGANVGGNRPLAVPLEVSFVSSKIDEKTLLVDRSAGWSGTNFCS